MWYLRSEDGVAHLVVLTKKVASKPPKPSKASIHQDHVNQELQEIKNQLSILTSNLLSVSKNSITMTSGVHTAQISDNMDNLLSTSNSIGSVSNIPYAQIVGSQQSGSTEKKIGVNPIPNLSMGCSNGYIICSSHGAAEQGQTCIQCRHNWNANQ